MGWQGPDPSTDFRGGGFISLENLIFFAKTYPVCISFFSCFYVNFLRELVVVMKNIYLEGGVNHGENCHSFHFSTHVSLSR